MILSPWVEERIRQGLSVKCSTPHLLTAASGEMPCYSTLWNSTLVRTQKTHTYSTLRCSNLLEDKQKRLRLNSRCTHTLLCGIKTLPAWDTAKKKNDLSEAPPSGLLKIINPAPQPVSSWEWRPVSLSLHCLGPANKSLSRVNLKSPTGSPAP